MGLLSAITKVAKTAVNVVAGGIINFVKNPSLKNAPAAAFDVATTVIPVGKVAKPIASVAKTPVAKSLISSAVKATSSVVKKASSVVKAIIPTTTKGKITAGIITPIVAGAVIGQPKETLSTAINAPKELFNFGGDVANFAVNPSIANAKEVIAESPLISSAVALTGAGLLTRGLGGLTTAVIAKEVIGDNQIPVGASPETAQQSGFLVTDKSDLINTISAPSPVTPQTNNLNTSSQNRRTSKRRKKVSPLSVNQRVNVIVSQRQNERYLNKIVVNKRWV